MPDDPKQDPAPSDPPKGDPPPGDPNPDPDKDTDWKAETEKWRRLSRQNEERANKNADAAKRLAEIEESGKSELEKAQAAKEVAAKEAADARLEAARLRVAITKSLTEAQAKRLIGTTQEELEADADELLASFRVDDDGDKNLPRRPRESLRGAGPNKDPEPSAKEIVDKMMARTF